MEAVFWREEVQGVTRCSKARPGRARGRSDRCDGGSSGFSSGNCGGGSHAYTGDGGGTMTESFGALLWITCFGAC
eukprot:14525429-Ditylum_brightwellii.AAC.2